MKNLTRLLCLLAARAALLHAQYTYYQADSFSSINTNNWTQNGSLSGGSTGLTAVNTNGSLISTETSPTPGVYEVETTIKLASSVPPGEAYVSYLDATPNALMYSQNGASFYAVEFQPQVSNGVCLAVVYTYLSQSGNVTQLNQTAVNCTAPTTTVRVVRALNGWIAIYINNFLNISINDSTLTSGQPGVGVRFTTSGDSMSSASIGALDEVAPNPISSQSIGTSSFSTRNDMQWQGTTDNTNGIGIALYEIWRCTGLQGCGSNNYVWVLNLSPGETTYSDPTVIASNTYGYQIVPCDFHLNCNWTTTIVIQTPPTGSVDPRRIGVRPTGAYWGASPEQIDVLSDNLNFTLPLMKAQARGGWGVTFNLTYNSQNWRLDPGGTWKLGRDVGYGFGWKLQAGAITPYFSNWLLDHYVFTDATGAEYRLNVNTNGVWTSAESVYLAFDTTVTPNRLYFRDGTFWVFGSTSAGTEQDTGSMYPTTMEDTNGSPLS